MVDPYDWLDVPKAHRPPTHYQLLGLSPNVAKPDEIRAATDRQLRRVQPHLTGPHGSLARILRAELAQARDTLLDPERRAIYDTLSADADFEEPPPADEPEPEPEEPAVEHESPTEPTAAPEWWSEATAEDDSAEQAAWWQEAVPDEPGPPTAPPAAGVPDRDG